ncbi:G-type lectin S-receptor-like serine/threonine-protein kinase SD1-13 isoform X3 [Arabidopsis lyrata subsp. lyrata]|uniref:G-type lectin S-receptor-like serine/threonine-protein kinase SD1-13 isoform X3 n=1 Tax=Arabidopsis lyrata subsp. lyrata TaxID=81972 RepID=UPI000A29B8B8|nr:G-type lectin S-receptor-like serine/threonine-protein kinase SD1-13 isoform X3 [Arabidopsis lyrata subsp. lyrata]|eukprot:XP_020866047.1 G-type lectin S-receptor-like serine/threonine-protein kinase SD1-13 isoform X3 [Arabidopsis lyrata subsp. lyrata]
MASTGTLRLSSPTTAPSANRNSPINDSSGMVAISKEGNLVVMDGRGQVHWSTNVSVPVAANTTYARLLNTGNLVLLGTTNSGDDIIWESFEHPQNIYLPTMRLATDAKTGRSLKLRSWKSPSDPSPGRYSAGLIPLPFPELVVWKDDLLMWRSGPWNGQYFIGLPNMDYRINLFELTLSSDNRGSVSMSYAGNTLLYHFLLDSEGSVFQRDWNLAMQEWKTWLKVPSTKCDTYATCGQFASCKFNYGSTPPCMCIRGFKPQSYAEWKNGNWTQGCVRKAPLQCERRDNNDGSRKSDRFVRVQKMKVPHNPQRSGANEQDCPGNCLKNCSCTAYSFDRGIGCLLWSGNLMDMQEFSGTGAVFYIRLADSEFKTPTNRSIVITVTLLVGAFLFAVTVVLALWKIVKHREKNRNTRLQNERMEALCSSDVGAILVNQYKLKELPLFEFQVLAVATDNFSITNKLGQGGFGAVYKGRLQEGQEIAVKRLSRTSGQGVEEFVNEVVVISKLQHRNLVRLLGFCIDGEERMLVYEFMPENCLDAYLFDPVKQRLLDWKTRFTIIDGICRGLMYLHRDSRLKIIHRDLKASNILLDENLNPKISDFGLARIFQGNEDEANTLRVVGTYGYMAPEYAMGGLFSEKSDVFSLGVILLEIVSGRRNSSFYNNEQYPNLSAYAWKLWNDGEDIALVDPVIFEECCDNEIRRCVHIGLLCVQDHANDRPSVATVIWMLSSENSNLPEPKQPAFIPRRGTSEVESSGQSDPRASMNNVSLTKITGR